MIIIYILNITECHVSNFNLASNNTTSDEKIYLEMSLHHDIANILPKLALNINQLVN